jgi:hypothetical protein
VRKPGTISRPVVQILIALYPAEETIKRVERGKSILIGRNGWTTGGIVNCLRTTIEVNSLLTAFTRSKAFGLIPMSENLHNLGGHLIGHVHI